MTGYIRSRACALADWFPTICIEYSPPLRSLDRAGPRELLLAVQDRLNLVSLLFGQRRAENCAAEAAKLLSYIGGASAAQQGEDRRVARLNHSAHLPDEVVGDAVRVFP